MSLIGSDEYFFLLKNVIYREMKALIAYTTMFELNEIIFSIILIIYKTTNCVLAKCIARLSN